MLSFYHFNLMKLIPFVEYFKTKFIHSDNLLFLEFKKIVMKKFFLSISVYFAYLVLLTPLISSAETGYNSLFIGHSFFRPFAEGLPFHATQAGITGHQQTVVFSGGCSGAPQALWEDDEKSQEIKQVLDGSDIDLFGMTYCGDYNTTEGYENWINYALEKNPNTRIAIALPWLDYPSLSTTEDYVNSLFSAYEEGWKNLIFQLKALYLEYPFLVYLMVWQQPN